MTADPHFTGEPADRSDVGKDQEPDDVERPRRSDDDGSQVDPWRGSHEEFRNIERGEG